MEKGRHAIVPDPRRAAIARLMVQSKQPVPHFYVEIEIEMDALLDALAQINAGRPSDARVTVTAALVAALARTLRDHRLFNATWRDDELELVDAVNVGVAIALDDGLIAPALLDCADRTVTDLAVALHDLVSRARTGRLRARELSDATFTLSNLGTFRVSAFTAIITPPQVAILATAGTSPRPVVRGDAVVVRRMMTATLSADHRAVDGAAAARFLSDLASRLEAPAGWLSPS